MAPGTDGSPPPAPVLEALAALTFISATPRVSDRVPWPHAGLESPSLKTLHKHFSRKPKKSKFNTVLFLLREDQTPGGSSFFTWAYFEAKRCQEESLRVPPLLVVVVVFKQGCLRGDANSTVTSL